MKKRIIKMVESILYARRNNNIKAEQMAYDKLLEFCSKNNIDFDNAFNGAKREIKRSIAANMNGIV